MQAIVTIFMALMLYGILHSILAAFNTKAIFTKFFGQRAYHGLYTLFFNTIALVSLLPIFALMWTMDTSTIWHIEGGLAWVLRGIQIIGLLGLGYSVLQIDTMRFLGVKQALAWLNDVPLPLPDEALQTGGVYRLVRHPLYFFSLLFIWPMPTMTSAWLGFNLAATLYFMIGSRLEERKLQRIFGSDYITYQKQVAWLIPFSKFGSNV